MVASASHEDEEARVDAELREVETSMTELQRRKAELLKAKEAIRRGKIPGPSKEVAPQPAEPAAAALTKALERTLNSLEWKAFKKKEGEWSFLRTRDGRLVDALESETEFVNQLRRGKEIVVGRYRYVVSEDKFLNRYFEA